MLMPLGMIHPHRLGADGIEPYVCYTVCRNVLKGRVNFL